MGPKKKQEVQKLSLGEFMQDTSFGGSWADEVEDTYGTQPLPPSERRGPPPFGGGFGSSDRGSYAPRDNFPQRIPDRPPYTAHLGNLSYDATQETVSDFFADCEIVSVRIVEDREQQRPKGFGYVEFASADGLKQALTLDGASFQGRSIRVRIADPPKDRDGRGDGPPRELDWSMRKGPLADIQTRNNDRRSGPGEFGDRRGDFNDRRGGDFNERRTPREPADDGKVRDFSDWSRKGPLSPRPEPTQTSSREGSRPPVEGAGSDFQRQDRRASPAAWGEGRQQQDGSRPPRREFVDRPEKAPSAAEKDMQWRSNMRPDNVKSPGQSRSGSEAPPSPAPAAAVPAAPSRPRLNLAKRTISEAPDATSPALTATDSKASPFGAARPIDTAAKEREIEQKRVAALQKQKEEEERAKEEQRLAKEAAEKKAEEEAAAAAAAAKAAEAAKEMQSAESEAKQEDEAPPKPTEAASPTEQKVPIRQREPREPLKTRATESGNWRQSSGEHRGSRGTPTGPRRAGGPSRGGRHDGQRPPRANGGRDSQPSTPISAGPEPTADEDGWTTVKKARGGARPIVS